MGHPFSSGWKESLQLKTVVALVLSSWVSVVHATHKDNTSPTSQLASFLHYWRTEVQIGLTVVDLSTHSMFCTLRPLSACWPVLHNTHMRQGKEDLALCKPVRWVHVQVGSRVTIWARSYPKGEYGSIEIPGDLITDSLRYKRVGSRPRRKNPGQRPLSPNIKPVKACQDKHLNFNSKWILQQKQNTWDDVINGAWVLFITVS